MKHKSTTDYQHFLEDLAGMYPFSVEEAVLVETIANCLDAKASVIKVNVDNACKTFVIRDNGKGMNEKEFENYHNFSMTFKEKGKGIGFAGLGAKLALRLADQIFTETCSSRGKFASAWEFKGREPEWEDVNPVSVVSAGTLVRVRLNDAGSILLDPAAIESLIIKHYLPLFLFADFYKIAGVYPAGVTFVVNDRVVQCPSIDAADELPRGFLYRGQKKKPFGIYRFTLSKEPVPDELQGIGISCFGKVINTEQKELFKQPPKSPDRVSGIVEVPELVGCLTTSKTAFRKDGSSGVKYYNFYKIAQHKFIAWLEAIGQRETRTADEHDRAVSDKLVRLVSRIITDIPELHTLFGGRQIKETLRPDLTGTETAGTPEVARPPVPIDDQKDKVTTEGVKPPAADSRSSLPRPGEEPASRRPRSAKFGPSISLISDERREDVSWTEGIERVMINKAHPAFRSAEKSGQLMYHYVLAVGLALVKELPADLDKMAILNRYLTAWGNL